jgi:hypothetical protein
MSTHDDDAAERAAYLATAAGTLMEMGLPRSFAEGGARWLLREMERQYRKAGSPYGPGHCAVMRWLEETSPRITTPSA